MSAQNTLSKPKQRNTRDTTVTDTAERNIDTKVKHSKEKKAEHTMNHGWIAMYYDELRRVSI